VICVRCGATVPDDAVKCPSCEQELSPGLTIPATPSRLGRKRERSDVTNQLGLEDLLEDAIEAEDDDILKRPRESSGADAAQEPAPRPRTTGRQPAVIVETESSDDEPTRNVPNPFAELAPAAALAAAPAPAAPPAAVAAAAPAAVAVAAPVAAPAAPRPTAPAVLVAPPVDASGAVEPAWVAAAPRGNPASGPRRAPGPGARQTRTAVTTAPQGRIGLPALLMIGAGLGIAAATLGSIYYVQQQDLRDAEARRARVLRKAQERRQDGGDAPRGGAPAAAPAAAHADGCPQGMRLVPGASPFCIDMYEYPGGRTLPRVGVTWREAKSVCEGRGARLCAGLEWERACLGAGNAPYPYGGKFEPTRCNVARPGGKPRELAESGAFAQCRSAAGIYDMSGNAAEWIDPPAYRGGSVEGGAEQTRCTSQVASTPEGSNPYVGFRCCASPPAAGAPAARPEQGR
jgi:hypothetical protein